MMQRGQIDWASLGEDYDRRPVCILTRDEGLASLTSVTCAVLTTRIRGIRSEVQVPAYLPLRRPSVISCDNVVTVPKVALDPQAIGTLDMLALRTLDAALVYALGIQAE
jgi:mRNA interferase MazF